MHTLVIMYKNGKYAQYEKYLNQQHRQPRQPAFFGLEGFFHLKTLNFPCSNSDFLIETSFGWLNL